MNMYPCNGVWIILIGPNDGTGPQILDSVWSTRDKAWEYAEDMFPDHIEQGLLTVGWQRIEE